MAAAIARLKAKVRPDSTVMVYFGGFGVQSDGQSYMIPVDARIWYEDDVRRDGVSIDGLLSELKNSGAHIRLGIIDASRRNPYERRFRSYSHGLAPIEADENALILTSMPAGQVADDPEGPRSLLIAALLDEMNSSTASLEQIFNIAQDKVARETQNRQIPTVSSSLIGDVKLGPGADNRSCVIRPAWIRRSPDLTNPRPAPKLPEFSNRWSSPRLRARTADQCSVIRDD
jgi:uncharacterized caspase-like protein